MLKRREETDEEWIHYEEALPLGEYSERYLEQVEEDG